MGTKHAGRHSFRDAILHKPYVAVQVTAAALTGAALAAQTFDATVLVPAGSHIDEVIVRCDEAATSSNGATTNLAFTVGRNGAAAELLGSGNTFALAAGEFSVLGGKGAAFANGSAPAAAGYTLRVTATPVGAGAEDLDHIATGDFTIFATYTTAPTLGES
jgi:hypothetical protein